MGKILVSPFQWGLGHATRDIPIIEEFIKQGHEVEFAADGLTRIFLKNKYPKHKVHFLPDIPVVGTSGKHFAAVITKHVPNMFSSLRTEKKLAKRLIEKQKIDLVFSDQRYNVWHPKVPSFIYTHQTRFMSPKGVPFVQYILEAINWGYMRKFTKIIVPDFLDEPNLSGNLSHKHWIVDSKKIHFAGPIADVKKSSLKEDIDYFISVSGPEPQRTVFEKIVLNQIGDLSGKVVVTLGKPGEKKIWKQGNAEIHSFMDRKAQLKALQRAKTVICRSGYTTVLELAEFRKSALMVPTVGQTEQEYLSKYYAEKGWFFSRNQSELDLKADILACKGYSGFPRRFDSVRNAKALYKDVFSKYLD